MGTQQAFLALGRNSRIGGVVSRCNPLENHGSRTHDLSLKSVDELLDGIVADILRGRPRAGKASVGPKADDGRVPVGKRHMNGQHSGPISYVLPSWRKKLKYEMPDNVRECEKLGPFVGTKGRGANSGNTSSTISLSPLVRGNPHLNIRRDGKRLPKSLPDCSGEKGLDIRNSVVRNDGLHKRKRGKNSNVLG